MAATAPRLIFKMSMSGGRISGMMGVTKNLTDPLLSASRTRSISCLSFNGGPRVDGSSSRANLDRNLCWTGGLVKHSLGRNQLEFIVQVPLTTFELCCLKDPVLVFLCKNPHPRKDLFFKHDRIVNSCHVNILEIFIVQSDLNALGLQCSTIS